MDRNYPGPCQGCCICPDPQLMVAHRGASKSKCGETDPTQPGKWFLVTVTTSSATSECDYNDVGQASCSGSMTYTETHTYDRSTCALTCTASGSSDVSGSFTPEEGGGMPKSLSISGNAVGCGQWVMSDGSGSPAVGCRGWCLQADPLATSTDTSSSSTSYSSEYTDEMLQADVVGALGDWPNLALGNDHDLIASAELISGSYSVLEGKYQWKHPLPPGGYYKITWDEVFTPDLGGAPTTTPQTYTWDGTKPPAYDPTDATTWPGSDVREVDFPMENGDVTLANVVISCIPGT